VSSSESDSARRRRPAARAAGAADDKALGKEHAAAGSPPTPSPAAGPEPGKVAQSTKSEKRVAARRPGSQQRALEPPPGPAVVPPPTAEQQIADLLSDLEGAETDPQARQRAADAIGHLASKLSSQIPASRADPDGLLNSARQFLSTDYYFKQWGRLAMRGRSEHVDDFGLDPTYEARVQPWLDLLYERYFRVQIEGAAKIPEHGAALLVCNHAGTLPWDGVMLKTALRHAHPKRRGLRWLTDDFVFHSPFLGAFLNRIGAVRACPENADRLLERGELLAVFPEGIKGIGKLFRERYQLQRFGRGGHVKLALRMGVPLIPLAIVGSEESYPLIYRLRAFSKMLGMPFIPVTPLFPWLGPLGLVPLPSRWHIIVGEPMQELAGLAPGAAKDSVLVNDLNEQLRSKVNALLQEALRARGHAFVGGNAQAAQRASTASE
jgi:1-acyl-sn-glycerol-3-phosphate acyltransferase